MQSTLDRLAAAAIGLPVRRTERLVLRPWQERDREPFTALNADPEVMEFFPATLTREQSDALIDTYRVNAARRGFGMFAVEKRDTREFIGMVGLTLPAWDAPFMPAVEIGWRFARSAWGQGFATEAARDVLAWAFDVLRLPRIVSFTVYENKRSWRVMERLGLTHVDDFGHPVLPEGHRLHAHLLYSIHAPQAPAPPSVAAPASVPVVTPPAPSVPALPRVWLDGDGCPRVVKEIVWKAAQRGVIEVTIVANRPLVVPRHPKIHTAVVKHGLDVADDWLVAHAGPGELVVTSDIPLAAELVPRGVDVISPRGEAFTPANIGEKLSLRDFFTEARASGMIEGSGPAEFDERAKREFANALDRWLATRRGATPAPRP